jgi:hypothetical protein
MAKAIRNVGGNMIKRKLAEFKVTCFNDSQQAIIDDIANFFSNEHHCNVDVEQEKEDTKITIWTNENLVSR